MEPIVILFGLGVGLLVGLTGVGGGSLMAPLLILVLGVKPVIAVGTDLAYGAVTKTIGAWRHVRLGHVDLRLSGWLAVGSIPGSLMGVSLVGWLRREGPGDLDSILLKLLGATLLLVSLILLGRALGLGAGSAEVHTVHLLPGTRVLAALVGLSVGVILGLTSVGSGALIGLALILVFRLSPHRMVGTDVFHAAVLLWVAGLAHFSLGNVDFRLAGNILLGSLPGVWVGSGMTARIPVQALRLTLAGVLMASGLGLLAKSGWEIPGQVIFGLPAVVTLAVYAAHKSRQCSATREPER